MDTWQQAITLCQGHSDDHRGTMPKGLDVGEVSIGSGSMCCIFDPLTVEHFVPSSSRNRAPTSSDRAFHRQKTFSARMGRSAWKKKLR